MRRTGTIAGLPRRSALGGSDVSVVSTCRWRPAWCPPSATCHALLRPNDFQLSGLDPRVRQSGDKPAQHGRIASRVGHMRAEQVELHRRAARQDRCMQRGAISMAAAGFDPAPRTEPSSSPVRRATCRLQRKSTPSTAAAVERRRGLVRPKFAFVNCARG